MRRRSQLIPWKAAGRVSERMISGDDVVRETGWVFNNATGDELTLAEFVATGDDEVPAYLETFGLRDPENQQRTVVEIGAGIGRMTCAFTREYGSVIACDLDQGFLERCYETVGRFGKVERLTTLEVPDGRTLDLAPNTADLAFSYITLQHCDEDDALELASEAVRVVRPGGKIALNFRGHAAADPIVVPAGSVVRSLYRVPRVGDWLSRQRFVTRVAWQASRLHPDVVTGPLAPQLTKIEVWTNPKSKLRAIDASMRTFEGVNPRHWWLVAEVT
ncbi:MAG: class I SAM-dependent methyltransferase [Ilumatobacter sp.]|uniref:class I SAM-dependent methyltransferase n=1 Tax=Ilumatobacter sp. TaxID=1967498 RepID=UPI0026285E64|nr:class I SAM-dependent methyltransferase [Ilumatobacter sp.]MDJ0767226.1 class I SAM-dependent methyltransferase [Ilumatobacter sp.]